MVFTFEKLHCSDTSVAEPKPPGAATFRVEPEPIFLLAGAESRTRLFKAAPAASFWQASERKDDLVEGRMRRKDLPE